MDVCREHSRKTKAKEKNQWPQSIDIASISNCKISFLPSVFLSEHNIQKASSFPKTLQQKQQTEALFTFTPRGEGHSIDKFALKRNNKIKIQAFIKKIATKQMKNVNPEFQ